MGITLKDIKKMGQLACLNTEHSSQLVQEINAIMDFAEQLNQVDTSQVAPLFHPLELHQPLRPDVVTEASCLQELEALAPLFTDNYYTVPKVLEVDE